MEVATVKVATEEVAFIEVADVAEVAAVEVADTDVVKVAAAALVSADFATVEARAAAVRVAATNVAEVAAAELVTAEVAAVEGRGRIHSSVAVAADPTAVDAAARDFGALLAWIAMGPLFVFRVLLGGAPSVFVRPQWIVERAA